MVPIDEISNFDEIVNRYDTTDPVKGGLGGVSNNPITALTNRTRWLYNHLNSFTGLTVVTSNTVINNNFLRDLIYINATANITLQLIAAGDFSAGSKLVFKCKNAPGKCCNIVVAAGGIINDGNISKNIYLYDGEEITLVAVSPIEWQVTNAVGNFYNVANDGMVRVQPRNTLIADGSSGYLRADYARLWELVQGTAIGDSAWLGDSYNYRGCFGNGDGVTTFRVPDMRAMQWRGLDMGRGVEYSRTYNLPGGWQTDSVGPHIHHVPIPKEKTSQTDGGDYNIVLGNRGSEGRDGVPLVAMKQEGATETVGKNIGLIPVIYF